MTRRRRMTSFAAALLTGLLLLPRVLFAGAEGGRKDRIDWDAFIADENYVVVGTSGTAVYDPESGETALGGDRKLPIALFKANDPAAEPLAYQELTAVFSTAEAFLQTIPADYQCEIWGPETPGVDDTSFICSQEPGALGRAMGSYRKHGGPMESGEAFESIHWNLEYSYEIHIVCKTDWPLEACVSTGGQIWGRPDYYEYAMADREQWEAGGWQLYETSLGGRRTLTRYYERDDSRIWKDGVLVLDLVDFDNLGIGQAGGAEGSDPARRDVQITDYVKTWDYTVLDELPHVPGFYAAICIHVEDCYSAMEAIGGKMTPEAGIIRGRYQDLVGEVTGTVPAAIAATRMKFAWVGEGEIPFLEQEDITDAQVKPGEDEGTEIDPDLVEGEGGLTPADIGLIVGGALAAGGAAALLHGGEDPEEEPEEKKRSRYKMYVNKNFDNILRIGDKPRAVFARIVEIPPGHGEIDRPDLTEQIQVFSGDGVLEVTDGGMSENGYKTAMVTVPADCRLREGEVSFRFTGKGGVYTRHVVFQLTEMEVIFWQPNLGLPANHTQTERLPFGVLGIPEETMELKAEIQGGVYTVVDLERDTEEKRFPLYYALIRETKPDKDPEKQKEPGTTETFQLHIEAKSPSPFPGEEELYTDALFPIHRIQMGLSLIMEGDAVGCYPKYKEGREEQLKIKALGTDLYTGMDLNALTGLNAAATMASAGFQGAMQHVSGSNAGSWDLEPCVTIGHIMLLEWDPEQHCIIRVAVCPDPEKTVVKATKMLSDRRAARGEPDEAHQALVERLGVNVFPEKKVDEKGRRLKFCATKARLDAPTRLRADITLTVEYKEETYQVTKNVLLHSMPVRSWGSDEEYRQMRRWDDHVSEYLTHVRDEIERKYMYHLFSLHDLIDRMLEGYNERFGYDGNQLDNVMRIWTGFLEGSHKGARGEAERLTLADDLEAAYAFLQGMRDNGGLLGRIALGICTAGYSEFVFFAMDLGEKMKDAVFACKGDEFGFWDGVVMGVKEYEKQLAMEFLVVGGLKLGGSAVNKITGIDLTATVKNAAAKYRAAVDSMDAALKRQSKLYRIGDGAMRKIGRFFNRSAAACDQAMKREQRANKAAREKADTIARRRQGKTDMSPEELKLQADYDNGMAEGMHKLRKLMEAQKELAVARGKGNYWECKAKYEAACREVWLDKNALKQLKRLDHPYATNMRAEFNAYRNRVKQRTTEKLLDDIAAETGKRREDLFIQSATSNDAIEELAGHKVPEDWDVTVREHVSADPGTVSAKPGADGAYDVMPTNLDPKKQVVMKQTASENALARNLYKEMYGVEAPSLDEALRAMKEADVTYVSPWGDQGYVIEPNLEAYADLPGMIDKSQFGRELNALALNRATFAYKGNEWYHAADHCLAEATRLEAGLATEIQKEAIESQIKALRYKAQACYVEGTRQITKQVTKIADPRNTFRMARGGSDMFSQQAREIHALALKVGDTMSPAEFFHTLRADYGIDKYAYTELMSNCLI